MTVNQGDWYCQKKNPQWRVEVLETYRGLVKYKAPGHKYVTGIIPEAMFLDVFNAVNDKEHNTDLLLKRAEIEISRQHDSLNRLLNETVDSVPGCAAALPDILAFVNRAIEWRLDDKNKSQYLWCFLRHVVDMTDVNFMGGLSSFTVNALMDDAAYRIDWRKHWLDDFGGVIWLPGGEPDTIVVDQSDPDAMPEVFWDNDGSTNAKGLLMAMDEIEIREAARAKMWDDIKKAKQNG